MASMPNGLINIATPEQIAQQQQAQNAPGSQLIVQGLTNQRAMMPTGGGGKRPMSPSRSPDISVPQGQGPTAPGSAMNPTFSQRVQQSPYTPGIIKQGMGAAQGLRKIF